MSNIFHFFHSTHSPFLHAHGELGTECLLGVLNLQGGERVLDFGCGTGSTLAKMISRIPTCDLYGYDPDLVAIQKTKNRLHFCGVANKVTLIRNQDELSSKDGTFDVIYIESVLAILPKLKVIEGLFQIRGLLKLGGRLVCNETIWLDNISNSEKLRLNHMCVRNFGIPQCSLIFSDLMSAISIIEKSRFSLIRVIGLDGFSSRPSRHNFIEYRSMCYSEFGKLMSYFRRDLQQDRRRIQKINRELFSNEKKYLSGQLLEFSSI